MDTKALRNAVLSLAPGNHRTTVLLALDSAQREIETLQAEVERLRSAVILRNDQLEAEVERLRAEKGGCKLCPCPACRPLEVE